MEGPASSDTLSISDICAYTRWLRGLAKWPSEALIRAALAVVRTLGRCEACGGNGFEDGVLSAESGGCPWCKGHGLDEVSYNVVGSVETWLRCPCAAGLEVVTYWAGRAAESHRSGWLQAPIEAVLAAQGGWNEAAHRAQAVKLILGVERGRKKTRLAIREALITWALT